MRSAKPEHMTVHKLVKATPRLSAAIFSAALVLSVPSYAETPASTEDLQATIETLKAALAARDAEIAALKANSVPPAAAPLAGNAMAGAKPVARMLRDLQPVDKQLHRGCMTRQALRLSPIRAIAAPVGDRELGLALADARQLTAQVERRDTAA